MVSFLQTAISAKANGIATTVINATGFTTPVMDAMNAGIPVVTYNADGVYTSNGTPDIGTNRLCYVGQALYLSGQQLGERIKSLVTTPGDIVIFIATPGTGNIQPRYDGAASVLKAAGYTVSEIATGAATSVELAAEKAYLLGTRVSRACSPSTRDPPSSSPRRWPAPACPAASRPADSTSPRSRSTRSRPERSTSPSTRTPTCRASCRRSTSTCTTCPVDW